MTAVARTEDEIRGWLVEQLAQRLRVDPGDVDQTASLVSLGLDSMQFVVLVGELEDWLGCRFAGNPLVYYPSVQTLAHFLAQQLRDGNTLIDPDHSVGG